MCLVSVTEPHAFKWVSISPFVARPGPVVWSAPCRPPAWGVQSSSLVLSRLVGVQGRLAVGLVSVC